MLIRRLHECPKITAGDQTLLRELLHPERQSAAIRYSLAHALLPPGASSAAHVLKTSEVYYILSGRGRIFINDENCTVAPGTAIYIPPGAVQHIENIGEGALEFLCIVDPAWRPHDETIAPDPAHRHGTAPS